MNAVDLKHLNDRFDRPRYLLQKKFLNLWGTTLYIYDDRDQLAFFTRQKAFKLKEDIRLYGSENMDEVYLKIQAREILDFSAIYDVVDPQSDEKVGAFKRKGLKSLARDEWVILDRRDDEIGWIKEDSAFMALLRRLLLNLIPQTYRCRVREQRVARFKQHFNPFIFKLDMDFSENVMNLLDPRMGVAAGVLLGVIEGRQN